MKSRFYSFSFLAVIYITAVRCLVPGTPIENDDKAKRQANQVLNIRKWAAVGDSYSAGIGAGRKLQDSGRCSRYDLSLPMQLQAYRGMPSPKPQFEFLSCSGATAPQILEQQVSALGNGYDMIVVSAGGNDVGLSDILNRCIYQWLPGRDSDCQGQLDRTVALIRGALPNNLAALAQALGPKLGPGGFVYWTGYAQFFDDSDPWCDRVTWSFWYNVEPAAQKQYLTRARRTRMNDLTLAVNRVIRETVARAGPQFVYIDYDADFGRMFGRYCEPGVREPDPNREDLLFFEWGTSGPGRRRGKRDDEPFQERSYVEEEARESSNDLAVRQVTGQQGLTTFEDTIVNAVRAAKNENFELEVALIDNSGPDPAYRGRSMLSRSDFVSDSILRVFHPQPGGYVVALERLLCELTVRQATPAGAPSQCSDAPVPGNR
ncbi:SGNH hydrolase-type esterase domain-containing protein [Macrophomina phaseolina]|uniref:SGNH hydrolase-type esterase domain-containing protein n=1 Tax=Macrophomina phaseolina TaxID=35725 RepID=A0ABQ8FRE1_9PEZI|nr:SGNH hydrolase-type esterase domain-containing protein [Macrophomina phaseolina]